MTRLGESNSNFAATNWSATVEAGAGAGAGQGQGLHAKVNIY